MAKVINDFSINLGSMAAAGAVRQFSVIGILKSRGGSGLGNLDNQTLVPITTAYYRLGSQRTTQGNITVQNINVQINKTEDIDDKSFYTLDNLFKLRPVLPEYVVNRWTKNITIEEDTWIYTNIAYKLQALGYQVPPGKIYKNKADLLAICG